MKKYSDDYLIIKKEAESKWPEWKISSYNTVFATSKHSKQLKHIEKTTEE